VILKRLHIIPYEKRFEKRNGKLIKETIQCRLKKIDQYEIENVKFTDIFEIETMKLLSHLMVDPETKKSISEVYDYIKIIIINPDDIKLSEELSIVDNRNLTISINIDAITINFINFVTLIKIRKFKREREIKIQFKLLREPFNRKMKCSDKVYDYILSGDFLLEDSRFWYAEIIINDGFNKIEYVSYYIPIFPNMRR